MKEKKFIRLGMVFLLPLAFIFSQCLHKSKAADPRGPEYAGATGCLKCHKTIYNDYLHAAHSLTSRAASQATIHGSFKPDSNTVIYNDSVRVVMEKHKDGLYQVKYTSGKPIEKGRFDIVFGSNRGETYLSWMRDEVHQLPVTYYINEHQWGNSPGGYFGDSVNFRRIIHERCFECHSSYIQNLSGPASSAADADSLDKKSLIIGIDCERCHGPAAAHVNFHTQNPNEKKPMYITAIRSLSRSQRIDLCSVCHSGNTNVMTKSTFGFKLGETLANYDDGSLFHRFQDAARTDVHGNQVKLLTSSKCFMSSNIECATCHNMHDKGIKTVKTYSEHCTSCHSEAKHNFCKMASQVGPAIMNNCLDCHMPVKTSRSIVINGAGKLSNPLFLARTHLIAVYPEESKKIMERFKAAP